MGWNNLRRLLLIGVVACGVVLGFVLLWQGCAYRTIHERHELADGRNDFNLNLPRGEYIVQIREDLCSHSTTKFRVRGSIDLGAQTILVDEIYTPSDSSIGVSRWFKFQGGPLRISLRYEKLGDGPQVYLLLGPHE